MPEITMGVSREASDGRKSQRIIFGGVILAHSTPYMAAAYVLAMMIFILDSVLDGQHLNFLSCTMAFSHLASSVLLVGVALVVMCAPRYRKSRTTWIVLPICFHTFFFSQAAALDDEVKL